MKKQEPLILEKGEHYFIAPAWARDYYLLAKANSKTDFLKIWTVEEGVQSSEIDSEDREYLNKLKRDSVQELEVGCNDRLILMARANGGKPIRFYLNHFNPMSYQKEIEVGWNLVWVHVDEWEQMKEVRENKRKADLYDKLKTKISDLNEAVQEDELCRMI